MSKQRQQEGYGKSVSAKHLKAARFPKSTASRPIFLPSDLAGLKLWCKFNSGITVAGAGVSQWDDVSGNDNHLKQGTDTNRPSKESDGSILFDGVDNYLKADAFTLVQPETIYLLFKQVTWTYLNRIFDGNILDSGMVFQTSTTPSLTSWAGAGGAVTADLAVDTYGAMAVGFDHDNSLNIIQINNNTPSIDTVFGTSDMGGFTLGANGSNLQFGNIQVKEVAVFSKAHDADTRLQMTAYLAQIGSLNI